jgi:hypothetical protein
MFTGFIPSKKFKPDDSSKKLENVSLTFEDQYDGAPQSDDESDDEKVETVNKSIQSDSQSNSELLIRIIGYLDKKQVTKELINNFLNLLETYNAFKKWDGDSPLIGQLTQHVRDTHIINVTTLDGVTNPIDEAQYEEIKKKLEEYSSIGKKITFDWMGYCRKCITMISTYSGYSIRVLDIKFDPDAKDDTFYKEWKEQHYNGDDLDQVGNEGWRYQMFYKRYNLSLESYFQEIKQLVININGNTLCFKNILSTLQNAKECTLFSKFAGYSYKDTHRTNFTKVQINEMERKLIDVKFEIKLHVS